MKSSILFLGAVLCFVMGVCTSTSAQTFDFNTGTTQNWTLDQMYETSTQNKITPFTSFVLSNQNNQLAASASPLLIGISTVKSYDIYLESPDLSSNSNWQNIAGYSIDLKRTLGSPCWNPPNFYFAQLQMKVIDTSDNNKEKLFAEHNGTNFVFHPINNVGVNYHFDWKPAFLSDPKYKVKHLRIRLTGPGDPSNGECAPKGSWLLDNVSAATGTASNIIVDVPNGGEVWEAETPHIIVWHTQNYNAPVKIEYSTNGGSSYSTIVASTANSGSYTWNVPNTPSTQCRVRVSDAASGMPSDVSDANFTIAANEAIFVDVPNGGESWEAGTPHYIVWHNHLFNGAVKIEYSTDGGSNYTTITASTANTGSHTWNVPNTPSTQCRVRISDAADGNPSDASDADFTITGTESITVDVPNGGENWEVGSPRFIVWHNHLFSDPVKIEYSTDGGSSYSTIVQSAPNTASYQWIIPDTPSSNCLVRISDAVDGNPSDESDASFTISSTAQTNTPPGSNIQVPLGSGVEVTFDNVISGGTTSLDVKTSGTLPPEGLAVVPLTEPVYYDITTTAGFTTSVEVCIEYNPGTLSTEQLAELTLQVYEETPGQWNNITTAHNVGAHIICGSVDHLSEFAVMAPGAAPAIMVIAPNGNEIWPVGSQQEIQWTSTDFTDPVHIEYSIDGNASHLEVVSSTANDGSYLWTIPNTPSTNCVVIISDAADAQPFDISDGVFTITAAATPSITVVSPNGGENWQVGTQQEIKWTSTNFTDPVKIEYSTDGGASYNDIETSTENDGTHIWQVPDNPASQCRVKISDAADGDPWDASDADFTISSGPPPGGGLLVENTEDSGPGSLRAAIQQANANVGPDTIRFDIPNHVPGHDPDVGIWVIRPQTPLPDITHPDLVIDGFSQAENIGEDSNPNGPEIVLDGSNAGTEADGLYVTANSVEIYGLTINRFSGAGVYIDGVHGGRISGCYIGTDFAGVAAAGNHTGVLLYNGTADLHLVPFHDRINVISGNTHSGVVIYHSSHNFVAANNIGLSADGGFVVGNEELGILIEDISDSNEVVFNRISGNSTGVLISHSNGNVLAHNLIGAEEEWEMDNLGNMIHGVYFTGESQNNLVEENLIGYNEGNGVYVEGSQAIRNTITRNAISRNGGLGIENDSGGNTELIPPVIVSASDIEISGTAGAGQIIEVFADDDDEGRIFLGSVTADASGNFALSFQEPVPLPNVTATCTDAQGNTSQFAPSFNVTSVGDSPASQIPVEFTLSENYPNPFNPETVIRYTLPKKSFVKLQIVNLMGEVVANLVDQEQEADIHSVTWNGTDEQGQKVASGIYLYRIQTGEFVAVKKMLFIK